MTYARFDELSPRYMRDLIRDFDLKDFQAAAVPGNGGAESAGFTDVQENNPTVKGSAGGLGHFQWTGRTKSNPRRKNFEDWLARNAEKGWTAHTYEANYSMLFRELVAPENEALQALKRTRTLEEATTVFYRKFERAGIEHMDSRIRWAKRALEKFRAQGGMAAVPAGPVLEPVRPVPAPAPAPEHWPEDDLVKAEIEPIQQRLWDLRYTVVGLVDGKWGDRTANALRAFQQVNGLPVDGRWGPATRAALWAADAKPMPVSQERESITADDLRRNGGLVVRRADKISWEQIAGIGNMLLAGLVYVYQNWQATELPFGSGLVLGSLPPWAPIVAQVLLCGYGWMKANGVISADVQAVKAGVNNGIVVGAPPRMVERPAEPGMPDVADEPGWRVSFPRMLRRAT